MKKTLILICIITFIFLIGCDKETDRTTIPPENSENNKTENTKNEQVKKAENLIYENKKYGFRILFPKSWDGRYQVVEKDNLIKIYQKSILDSLGEHAGNHLTITVFTPQTWETEGKDLVEVIRMKKIDENDEHVFAVSFPTDVQYDPQNPEMTEKYKKMQKEVDEVVDSFELIEQ